ncbi:amino acid permease [Brevundimonas diminuta]|uniref:amino acid permease n=1 Tax=Brevundimonas diminuta TaxID=293 RepID=UPI001908A1C6|nr:amino acid permease [Brevundimonas diminuta]MBK1974386.1 amino acid permease [Brevundimonas diminuta]
MSQVDILPEPSHRIGWGLAALVVAGNMIGSGVYLLPATLAPTGSSSVIGWLVCGIGAVTLALVFGGLGRMQPEADGLSDFARRGLGRFLGYQTGLAYWAACLTGNVAVAVAGTGYLAFFFPALKEPMWGAVSNLALIWLTTAAYAAGSKTAARFGAITLVLGLVPIGLAIIAGVIAFSGETFAASWSPAGEPLMKTVPASLAVIFWAFLGVESAAALSSQVKNPATDVGRASLGGVLLAFVVYVAASVAVFGVIPADVLAHSTSPYADLVARVMGASVAGLVSACAVIKATGTIAGWTMMGGETARASAEAGWLPRWFGGAQKGRTPLSNPLINGVIMSAMVIASAQPTLGQQFGVLIGVTSVLTLCLYALCSVTLWKLTTKPGWRLLAVGGAVFSAFAVAAAAGGYIWPSVGFFAVTSLAWLWVRKRQGRFQAA